MFSLCGQITSHLFHLMKPKGAKYRAINCILKPIIILDIFLYYYYINLRSHLYSTASDVTQCWKYPRAYSPKTETSRALPQFYGSNFKQLIQALQNLHWPQGLIQCYFAGPTRFTWVNGARALLTSNPACYHGNPMLLPITIAVTTV